MSDEQQDTQAEDLVDESGVDPASNSVYELAYHIVPSLGDDDRATRVDAIRKLVEDAGGVILNDVYPEHMDLEYTMTKPIAGKLQRFDTAFFGWINFELTKDAIATIKDACDKDDTLIRFLITTTTKELAMTQTRPSFKKELEAPVVPATSIPAEAPTVAGVPEEEASEEMSEEEVDKAIDDLVEEPANA